MFEQFMQVGKEWGFPAALLFALCVAIFIIYRQKAAQEAKLELARQDAEIARQNAEAAAEKARQEAAATVEKMRLAHEQKRQDENAQREAAREERMGKRLDVTQEMIQTTMFAQLEKSNSAIARIGQVSEKMQAVVEQVSATHDKLVESNKLVVEHCTGAKT